MKSKKQNFTLIELLISLVIMAMVMVAIWQITLGVLTSRKFVEGDYEPTKAGNIALGLLLKEIQYAHKFYIQDLPITEQEEKKFNAVQQSNQNKDKGASYLMLFNGETGDVKNVSASRLEFYSSSPLFDPRKGAVPNVSKIQYYLESYEIDGQEVPDRVNLMRASLEARPRYSEHGEPQVVLPSGEMVGFSVYKGIRLFNIQYYNGLEWVNVWTTSSEQDLPMAVRIDMVVNQNKPIGDPLPPIQYTGYDEELELQEGDVRLKGMVYLYCSEKTIPK